jgi:hypothetical protein
MIKVFYDILWSKKTREIPGFSLVVSLGGSIIFLGVTHILKD